MIMIEPDFLSNQTLVEENKEKEFEKLNTSEYYISNYVKLSKDRNDKEINDKLNKQNE